MSALPDSFHEAYYEFVSAVTTGNVQRMCAIIERGLDVGTHPFVANIMWAAVRGSGGSASIAASLKILLAQPGVGTEYPDPLSGSTLLHVACSNRNNLGIRILLEAKADATAEDLKYDTPMDIVMNRIDNPIHGMEKVRLLCARGAASCLFKIKRLPSWCQVHGKFIVRMEKENATRSWTESVGRVICVRVLVDLVLSFLTGHESAVSG